MRVIDDRGYLFGRINIIDAAVVFLLLWCIPLGLAAYKLFRAPAPEILSVTPSSVPMRPDTRILVEGRNFRPYLRANAGPHELRFLMETSTRAEMVLPPELPAGTYDIIIYDLAQEVARRKDALVVVPPSAPPPPPPSPNIDIEILGAFADVDAAFARKLHVSQTFGKAGEVGAMEVLALDPPAPEVVRLRNVVMEGQPKPNAFRVPALLRVRCSVNAEGDCRIGDRPLTAGEPLTISADNAARRFDVTEIYPGGTTAVQITMVCATEPSLVAALREELAARPPRDGRRVVTPELVAVRELAPAAKVSTNAGGITWEQAGSVFSVVLRVPAGRSPQGWRTWSQLLKVGQYYTHHRPSYILSGLITRVELPAGVRAK